MSQVKTQIMKAEIFQLPIKHQKFGEREDTLSPSLFSHYFLLIYNIMLLLVLYERCSDAVSDDNPVKPPKMSCGRIMLRNPISISILSILIPRFFFLHFVKWGPGNTWHQRARGKVILLFFCSRSVYALPWYILGMFMLISNLHQHNYGKKSQNVGLFSKPDQVQSHVKVSLISIIGIRVQISSIWWLVLSLGGPVSVLHPRMPQITLPPAQEVLHKWCKPRKWSRNEQPEENVIFQS